MEQDGSSTRERVLRFDLAVQRNHLLVYSAAFATGLIGFALGAIPLNVGGIVATWMLACAVAVLFHTLYRRGVSRDLLNPLWIVGDAAFVTAGIAASGGIASPGYIWYLTTASAAAFVIGRRGAFIALLGSMVAYLSLLGVMGQIRLGDAAFFVALTRAVFLVGASFFFIAGIANLQGKRLRIRRLERDAQRQIEELRRLSTELGQARDRIQEADRLKSRFLANMSHELRTPMNSIIGFSQILIERLEATIEPKHHGFLRHIHSSGEHLLGIINGVLDLSKVEAGKMEVYFEFVQVQGLLESICDEARAFASARTIVLDVPAGLPYVETDAAKFRQVLLNLLTNAMKFSPLSSTVTVAARLDAAGPSSTLTVSVRDEGFGIAPEHHETIFEEFRQVDATPRREFGGTGLGLAIVRKLVELQRGSVAVVSAPGAGSTFSLTLPVRTRAAPAPEDPETSAGGSRILVVEDDPGAWELIAGALASAGYTPVHARHAEEAVRLATSFRPLAITLDIVLPGVDGWEVLRRLKTDEATRDVPVVIVSRIDQRDLAVAMGAEDYILKPVDTALLVRRLATITQKERPRLLLIDDERSVHDLLAERLPGFVIEGVFDGESGIIAARAGTHDAIILDLIMPGMNGFEVAEALKRDPRTAHIPILMLTAKEIAADEQQQLSLVSCLVQKGQNAPEQLVREIQRLGVRAPGVC